MGLRLSQQAQTWTKTRFRDGLGCLTSIELAQTWKPAILGFIFLISPQSAGDGGQRRKPDNKLKWRKHPQIYHSLFRQLRETRGILVSQGKLIRIWPSSSLQIFNGEHGRRRDSEEAGGLH